MEIIKEIVTQEIIDIPEDATSCSIVLYIDNASAGQSYTTWDLTQLNNSLAFANNQSRWYAYTNNKQIIIDWVIAYVIFFK